MKLLATLGIFQLVCFFISSCSLSACASRSFQAWISDLSENVIIMRIVSYVTVITSVYSIRYHFGYHWVSITPWIGWVFPREYGGGRKPNELPWDTQEQYNLRREITIDILSWWTRIGSAYEGADFSAGGSDLNPAVIWPKQTMEYQTLHQYKRQNNRTEF